MGRAFTWAFKRDVVNYAALNGVKAAARQLNVDPKSVREWRLIKNPTEELTQSQKNLETSCRNHTSDLSVIKYREENNMKARTQKHGICHINIHDCKGRLVGESLKRKTKIDNKVVIEKYQKKRLANVGRKGVSAKMENLLASWVTKQQKSSVLTIPMIQMKALELFKAEHGGDQKNFKASYTWVGAFLKRNNLSIESNTSTNAVFQSENFPEIKVEQIEDIDSSNISYSNSSFLKECNLRRSAPRTFDSDFKLNVVKCAQETSIVEAAKEYNVDPKSVREWCRGQKLKNCKSKLLSSNSNFVKKNKLSRSAPRTFNLDFKLSVVKCAGETSIRTAAKKYNVDTKSVWEWCRGQKLKSRKLELSSSNSSFAKKNNFNRSTPRTFNLDFKLDAIKCAQETSIVEAAKKYKVDPKCIREWCKGQNLKNVLKNVNSLKTDMSASVNNSLSCTDTKDFKSNAMTYTKENNDLISLKKHNIGLKSLCERHKLKTVVKQKNSDIALKIKLSIIKYAKKHGIKAAAKKYYDFKKSIYEWYSGQKLTKVLSLRTPCKNRISKKCKNDYKSVDKEHISEEIENVLTLWILELMKNNVLITGKMIKNKTLELLKSEYNENFHPTDKWVRVFLNKRKLNLKSNVNVEETLSKNRNFSLLMTEQTSEGLDKSLISASDLNWTYKDLKTKRKLSKGNEFIKKNVIEDESSCDEGHLISCTSLVAHSEKTQLEETNGLLSQNLISHTTNEYQIPVRTNKLFSQNSQSTLDDPSGKGELISENNSKTVHPTSVQGMIARIAFQTLFERKHI